MSKDKNSKTSSEGEKRKTLFGWFLARDEPDKEYLPDLKHQWEHMDRSDRVKFILGVLVGALLFIGSLILVYLLLAAMVS
jgi:hypothetical protein